MRGLRQRPGFRWREDCIRAHPGLCWLALLLIRVVENATGDSWRSAFWALRAPLVSGNAGSQCGYVESFHARLRDECFGCEQSCGIDLARVVLETWRIEYNTEHPHSPLGYSPLAQSAAATPRPIALVPA